MGELLMDVQPYSLEAGQLLEHSVRTAPRDPDARHSYARWAHVNLRERICVAQEKAALVLPGLDDDELLQMNTLLGICSGRIEDAAGGSTGRVSTGQRSQFTPEDLRPGGGLAVR